MRYALATLATLALGVTPSWACNPLPVVPGNGLLQQQILMQQSYASAGIGAAPTLGCGVGAAPAMSYGYGAGVTTAPVFAPTLAPSYGAVGYGSAGVVPVPVGVGAGVNVNVFNRGRGIFHGHHHGGVRVRFPF